MPSPINMLFNIMKSRGINLPNNVNMNDPNQILDYLMKNGKISQDQYNNAYQKYRQMFGMNNSQQTQ